MDDPRHLRLGEIFLAADQCPQDSRAAYLDDACGDDVALRAEVEAMLAHDRLGALLNEEAPADLVPGALVDRYRIVRRLDEGGMGVVYLAEQEAPVCRTVALKLVKLGMDTRTVISRFNGERQALLMMDHPNVARALDAGATERGRPYFVMEYVDGEPITTYCNRHHVGIVDRLELFIAVCGAIQHAHQKGIIHRDIKPSNILVTQLQGRPVAKVIDFGIAKATGSLLERSLSTQAGQILGTLDYMSPEQTAFQGLDTDTRSDVYALGAVLYELLTGVTALDLSDHLAIGELQRAICTVDPMPPSRRVRRLTRIQNGNGGLSPAMPARARRLRGDLDGITLKCLHKDRTRRYDSVEALAEDVRRHLRFEPVGQQAKPTPAHRLGRFLWRHRISTGLVSIIVAAFLTGGVINALLTVKLAREVRTALKIQELFVDTLLAADPVREGASLTVAEALNRIPGPGVAGAIFDEDPIVEARIRSVIGTTTAGVGSMERGIEHLRVALQLRRAHLGVRHSDTHTSMNELVDALLESGRFEDAKPLIDEALDVTRRYAEEGDLNSLWARHNEIWYLGDYDRIDVVPRLQRLVADGRRALGPDHPALTIAIVDLVEWLAHANELELAESLIAPAMEASIAHYGETSRHTLNLMRHHAMILDWTDRHPQAIALQKREMELRRRQEGELHPEAIWSMRELGDVLHHAGQLEEAERVFLDALERAGRNALSMSWRIPLLERDYGELLVDMGRMDEAGPYLQRGYNGLLATRGASDPMTVTAIRRLGRYHRDLGDDAEAARWEALLDAE